MCALFPQLRQVWAIPPVQATAVGKAWEKKLSTGQPGEVALRTMAAMPLLAALGTTAVVLLPRFAVTLAFLRERRSAKTPSPNPFNPVESVRPPTAAPYSDTLAGSGYAGERADEFSSIDGTDVVQ